MFFVPPDYSDKYLEYSRIQPVFSNKIIQLIQDVLDKKVDLYFLDKNYPMILENYKIDLLESFKFKFLNKIKSSKLNHLKNLDYYNQIDICLGCTQFIDNLYLSRGKENIQILVNEYRYHNRLFPYKTQIDWKQLEPNKDLILSLPFVSGDVHQDIEGILDLALEKQIQIHLDCAWLTAAKNIDFDFNHPAIGSIGISLSKGFGLGWNRIGLRLSKHPIQDSISIMNQFQMVPTGLVCIANYFLDNLEIDHLWNTHQNRYNKICNDFSLTPTNSIHVARNDRSIIGVCDLIRYLEVNYD